RMAKAVERTSSPRTRVLRRVIALFRPYRRQVLLLLLAVVLSAALSMASPVLTKLVFDRALFPRAGGARLGLLSFLVGLIALSVALGGVVAVGQTYLTSVVGQGLMHDLRKQLYEHLQRMSLSFFTRTRTGE